MKKFLIFVIVFAPLAAFGFYFLNKAKVAISTLTEVSDYISATSTRKIIQKVEEKVAELPPVLSRKDYQESLLSVGGIFDFTNRQRKANGSLPSLSQNSKLNQIAGLRIKDMFEKEYFEHKSPSGAGASDIAYDVGYEFILIGENIALGNFEGDEALVQAWMDSLGHRANILNSRYTEIGIAAERGLYKGKKVWLAVQIFGRPLNLCNEPDYSLTKSISESEERINLLNIKAKAYYFEIESMKAVNTEAAEEYNKKVGQYNEVVRQIKILNSELKSSIDKYNNQVKVFNACIEK
ncbi:MAG: CAP domain-containing protein [Patescibacteria group bacterium]